ncbi:MAG: hypothetical protein AB7N80_15710 [Bdellovibrionales bacterium]
MSERRAHQDIQRLAKTAYVDQASGGADANDQRADGLRFLKGVPKPL